MRCNWLCGNALRQIWKNDTARPPDSGRRAATGSGPEALA